MVSEVTCDLEDSEGYLGYTSGFDTHFIKSVRFEYTDEGDLTLDTPVTIAEEEIEFFPYISLLADNDKIAFAYMQSSDLFTTESTDELATEFTTPKNVQFSFGWSPRLVANDDTLLLAWNHSGRSS